MNQHDDSSFFRTFALVLGALVFFTVFIAIMANLFSPATDRENDPLVLQEQKRQIAPIGQSRVAATEQPAAEPVAEVQPAVTQAESESAAETEDQNTDAASADSEATESESTGSDAAAGASEDTTAVAATAETAEVQTMADAAETLEIPVRVRAVAETNCAGCHRDGLLGAQRSDDAEAWQTLQEQGLEALTASVINGKGAMLPRAETTLTDEEITLAIRYMIEQATGGDAAGMSDDTGTAEDADSSAQSAEDESAMQEQAAAEETTAQSDASDQPADTDAAAVTTTAETAEQGTVVAAAEIPANVKTVVDTLCAGCHISGVANAPKYGDKAAWDERLAVGMDKVLASAIAGKGAMPARGGSTLSDAELRLAIEYMATK